MRSDTLLNRLILQQEALEARLQNLEQNSSLAIETVGVQIRTFAELPPAGVKGRMYYVTNGRKAGEGAGAGTGVLAIDDEIAGTPTWVRVDDPTQAVAI